MARQRRQPPVLDQITPHFRLAEFHCRDGTPVPRSAHAALERLCEQFLEPLRERYGKAIVISGFRHRRFNAKYGGPEGSIHCYELHPQVVAADVRFARAMPDEWAAFAEGLGAPGVGRYEQSRFLHVDNRKDGPARWNGSAKPLQAPKVPRARKPALDQITKHFRVAEFDCQDGTPVPAGAHDALRRLCEEYLEPMRARFGAARVLSGFRHRAYNDRIGGAAKSMHCYEEHPDQVAADLRFARGTPAAWTAFAEKLGAPGVGRYDDSVFVHCDNRKTGPARWTGAQR
jgi:uncharacterized protein YcbK (DUF882 family)